MVRIRGVNYHFECQFQEDGTIVFRLLDYDFQAVLAHQLFQERSEDGMAEIYMPRSAVICLDHTKNTPDKETCRIIFGDGTVWNYQAQNMKVQDYGPGDVGQKKLYIIIPFMPIRIRKCLERKEGITYAKKELTKLLKECKMVLREGLASGALTEKEHKDITEYTVKACEHIFRDEKYTDLLEEVYRIMMPDIRLDREIIADQKMELEAKDQQLEAKDQQLEAKNRQIKAKEKQLKEQERKISTLKKEQEKERNQMMMFLLMYLQNINSSVDYMREQLMKMFPMTPEAADKEITKFKRMASNFGN